MQNPQKRREAGFTLTEVLVSIAVFTIIFIGALMIYDRSNRVFKTGTEASELQQNTRVAFEKLVSDTRMAGFDYDRDGIPFSSASGVNAWQGSRAYAVGNVVTPTSANGYTYLCTTAGTSNSTEPVVWSTTVGGITNDGTVRWTTQAGVNQFQQPDEQIEYPGAHAITFRANFDYEQHRDASYGREGAQANSLYGKPNLESPQFPVITTGNDEIVTYALHSERTGVTTNTDSVKFYADVPDRRSFPGGRSENLVTIDDVDLCLSGCNNPPYTLQRITLDDDGLPVRTPLATNVRDLTFQYYSNDVGTGTPLTYSETSLTSASPPSAGGGQYNPLTPATSATLRNERGKINSVRITLIGMNQGVAEANYINPAEAVTSPVRNYRTYQLTSLVVPRNLGKVGQHEVQTAPPGAPRLQSVCVGYCGMAKVEWIAPPANADEGQVEQYVIIYDTVSPPVRYQQFVLGGTSGYVSGLTPGTRYYFTVAAVNSYGTRKAVDVLPASAPGLDPINRTTPSDPSNMTATGNPTAGMPAAQQNQITLNWDAPSTVTAGSVNCIFVGGGASSGSAVVPPLEIDQYEVWRGDTANFVPPGAGKLVSINTKNDLVINQSSVRFIDRTAVPCKRYYYRVRGLKASCNPPNGTNNQGGFTPSTNYFPNTADLAFEGKADPSNIPGTPVSLLPGGILAPAPAPSCGVTCTVTLEWPKVVVDASTPAKAMTVEDYVLTRERWKSGALDTDTTPGPASVDIDVVDTTAGDPIAVATFNVSNDVYYEDAGLPSVDPGGVAYQYRYRVRAKLPCTGPPPSPATAWISNYSPEYRYPCLFTGGGLAASMSNTVTGDGMSLATAWQGDGNFNSSLTVTGTGIAEVQVLLKDYAGSNIINLGTVSGAGPYVFPITGTDEGSIYTIYVVAKDASGCLDIRLFYYEEGTPTGCCLAAQATDPFVVQFTPGADFIDVLLKNSCGNTLNLQTNGFRIDWNPAAAGIQAGTRLQDIDFPTAAGGTQNQSIGDTTGNVITSVPGGGLTTIASGATYLIRLNFNKALTTTLAPLTNVCISYQRSGIDTSNQNCRIVPQPSAVGNNSCN